MFETTSERRLRASDEAVAEDRSGVDRDVLLIRRASVLAKAREMRDSIDIVVTLLAELDDLSPEEPDTTVFREIADLFRDIGEFSLQGAYAARTLAGEPNGAN